MPNSWNACLLTLEGHSGPVCSVAWSPDGTRLASASFDTTVKVWDPATGQCISTLQGHNEPVTSVAWSHEGTRLASAADDKTVKIWDPVTAQCVSTLEGRKRSESTVIAWSCIPRQAVSIVSNHEVTIWNADTGQCISRFWDKSPFSEVAALSRDGTRVTSRTGHGEIEIQDAVTGHCLCTLENPPVSISSMSWSQDGTRVASASSPRIQIWDAATGRCVSTLGAPEMWIDEIAWSNDASQLASVEKGKLRIHDLATGQCVSIFEGYHDVSIYSVAWSPTCATRLASALNDATVKIWDISASQQTLTSSPKPIISAASESPDAARFAFSDYDTVRIYDLGSGHCVSVLEDTRGPIRILTWSLDATKLALALGYDIQIFDLATGRRISRLEGQSGISSIAWSVDATRLASKHDGGTTKIWDLATGHCIFTLDLDSYGGLFASLAWSYDATRLASTSRSRHHHLVKIWDSTTGQCTAILKGHHEEVNSVAWSCDAMPSMPPLLASASEDATVKIWDPASGQCLSTLRGHDAPVLSVTWSYDATRLASGSSDETVNIWDPATGQWMARIEMGRMIDSVRFHKSNSDLLRTDLGMLDLHTVTAATVSGSGPAFTLRLSEVATGCGVSGDRAWITYQGRSLLWVPPEYRANSFIISGTTVSICCSSDRILIYKFSASSPI